MQITIEVIGDGNVQKYVDMLNTDAAKIKYAEAAKEAMSPYVPMQSGELDQGASVSAGSVTYNTVYAHYQYEGTDFNFSHDAHPKACAHWDEAAHDEIVEGMKAAIIDAIKSGGH